MDKYRESRVGLPIQQNGGYVERECGPVKFDVTKIPVEVKGTQDEMVPYLKGEKPKERKEEGIQDRGVKVMIYRTDRTVQILPSLANPSRD